MTHEWDQIIYDLTMTLKTKSFPEKVTKNRHNSFNHQKLVKSFEEDDDDIFLNTKLMLVSLECFATYLVKQGHKFEN